MTVSPCERLLANPAPVAKAVLAAVSVLSSTAAAAEASSPDGDQIGARLLRGVAQVSHDILRTQVATNADLLSKATVATTHFRLAFADASIARREAARNRIRRLGRRTE